MLERARQKMIAAVNAGTGRTDCGEAVMLIQRPWWTYAVFVVLFIGLMALIAALGLGPVIGGAIAGGLAGGAMAGLGKQHLLGYCDGTVVLLSSSPFAVKATGIVSTWAYPVPAEFNTGLLFHKVTLDGKRYQLAKPLGDRYRAITGVAS